MVESPCFFPAKSGFMRQGIAGVTGRTARIMSMIVAKQLTKRFGAVVAVDNVSFEVQKGEIVGFLGLNGAGKTTAMRMLTGYLSPTSGSAEIAGLDVCEHSLEVRRRIGYLPENAPLYPEMRVDEYLRFRAGLKGVGGRRIGSRLDQVKELCGLQDSGRRIIGQLSRGYWQRVGLADAIVHEPEVLILDEPTMGMDPNQIRSSRELIRSFAGRYTMLFSTHHLPEAQAICQRAMIINKGRIAASGTPGELLGLLKGNVKVVAEIQGPAGAVRDMLLRLPGALSAAGGEDDAGREPGWDRYVLECGAGRDLRADVFTLAARNGWLLRELRVERGSLEDAFVEMTAQAEENGVS